MKTVYRIPFMAALLFIAACSILGGPKPETFNERLAVGYVSVTAVRQQATSLLTSRVIEADDARKVQNVADQARAALDIASVYGAQPKGQEALLTAINLLTEVQRYLAEKEKR